MRSQSIVSAKASRIAREGWNEDLLNEVDDIMDEAVRKIERAWERG